MIRTLSVQKPYDAFFTKDPAIRQLPDGATEEQKKEHARLMKLARDSGKAELWNEITSPGEKLTKFQLRPLKSEQYGELRSMLSNGRSGFEVAALAFRFALVDASPLDEGVFVEFVNHPRWGSIATTDFLDKCGAGGEYGAMLIDELGTLAFQRASDLNPLS